MDKVDEVALIEGDSSEKFASNTVCVMFRTLLMTSIKPLPSFPLNYEFSIELPNSHELKRMVDAV